MSLRTIKARSLGRLELLEWVNTLLDADYSKVEHLGDGVAYMQILDAIHPNLLVPLHKINFNARTENTKISNLRVVQHALEAHGIKKELPIKQMAKCKFADNIEMLQWCYAFLHTKYPDANTLYKARLAREEAMTYQERARDNRSGKKSKKGKRKGNIRNTSHNSNTGTHGNSTRMTTPDRHPRRSPNNSNSGGRSGHSHRTTPPSFGSPKSDPDSPDGNGMVNLNLISSNSFNNSLKPGLSRSPPDDVILGGSPESIERMKSIGGSGRGNNDIGRKILNSTPSDKYGIGIMERRSSGNGRGGNGSGGSGGNSNSGGGRGGNGRGGNGGDGGGLNGHVNNTPTDESLHASRIPVSSSFFSNLYGNSNRGDDGGNDEMNADRSISDSSLTAGLMNEMMTNNSTSNNSFIHQSMSTSSIPQQQQQQQQQQPKSPVQSMNTKELLSKMENQLITSNVSGGFIERLEAAVRESSPDRKTSKRTPTQNTANNQINHSGTRQNESGAKRNVSSVDRKEKEARMRANSRKQILSLKIIELENELTKDLLSQKKLEDNVENVRVERDFYYDTLREIENELNETITNMPELKSTTTALELLSILESQEL